MSDEKHCKNCQYFHTDAADDYDHRHIPMYHYCTYKSQFSKEEVDPNGSCANFEKRDRRKRTYTY